MSVRDLLHSSPLRWIINYKKTETTSSILHKLIDWDAIPTLVSSFRYGYYVAYLEFLNKDNTLGITDLWFLRECPCEIIKGVNMFDLIEFMDGNNKFKEWFDSRIPKDYIPCEYPEDEFKDDSDDYVLV